MALNTIRSKSQSSMSAVSHTAGLTNIAYAPLIQNYNYNLISGQAVQNAGWDPAHQDIHYYN